MDMRPELSHVKQVKEIRVKEFSDVKEIAALLSTGKWIAMTAIEVKDGYLFSLGRTGN